MSLFSCHMLDGFWDLFRIGLWLLWHLGFMFLFWDCYFWRWWLKGMIAIHNDPSIDGLLAILLPSQVPNLASFLVFVCVLQLELTIMHLTYINRKVTMRGFQTCENFELKSA
jgi:hypothetical protein